MGSSVREKNEKGDAMTANGAVETPGREPKYPFASASREMGQQLRLREVEGESAGGARRVFGSREATRRLRQGGAAACTGFDVRYVRHSSLPAVRAEPRIAAASCSGARVEMYR